MKSFSAIHILLLLILMLAYQCAGAQNHVITVKGDSVAGKIKLMDYGDVPKVQVTNAEGQRTILTMYQTREVAVDGTIYRPQKGPAGYSFMKLEVEGYLSLYAFKPENQHQYDGQLLVKKDGTFIEVPNLTFKKTMKNFLSDCYDVTDKLEAGTYSRKDLRAIIDEYNRCIDKKTVTPVAQKPVQQPVVIAESSTLKKWTEFESKVKVQPDFEGKSDVLEMMSDISKRLGSGEKVPNYLIQGLRGSLKEPALAEELESLLTEIQKL